MKPLPSLRQIPSVDKVLRELGPCDLPRPMVLAVVRHELEAARDAMIGGGWLGLSPRSPGSRTERCPPVASKTPPQPPTDARPPTQSVHAQLLSRIRERLDELRRGRIQPVINGTGVLIHTNLGRSPLAPAAVEAMRDIAGGYSNLEYDLARGERGRRGEYVEQALALLCDAEAAAIVNNCAAALVLILRHFASRDGKAKNQVVISRGELIQIGGGFRIPEILQAADVELCEVGTTNRTSLADYEKALGEHTAMILKVHRSNFHMEGFVESPPTRALADLAHRRGIPFVEDLGSGALHQPMSPHGHFSAREISTREENGEKAPAPNLSDPTPAQVLGQGVDLVCFSGDKLLGGPQAGIIVGCAQHVAALKRDPFFRALRCDKLILTALQATAELHLSGQADQIPIVSMMRLSTDELRRRAVAIADELTDLALEVGISQGQARIGGGAMPHVAIPSVALNLRPTRESAQAFADRLRRADPPVIGYLSDQRLRLDLRTIFPEQDESLVAGIRQAVDEVK